VLPLLSYACMPSSLPRQVRWNCSLVCFHRHRPSPIERRVSSCIKRFEACSTFTRVTTCMLTEPPMRPFTPKASAALFPRPLLRLLPGGTNQFPGGSIPRWKTAPFTAHVQTIFSAPARRSAFAASPGTLRRRAATLKMLCLIVRYMGRRGASIFRHLSEKA
jgi:hypothetical protein